MRALGRQLARLFVALRWVLLPVAIGVAVWALLSLPPLEGDVGGSTLESLVPESSSAIRAERLSGERFAFPLLTRTMIVVRDPHGLPAARQAQIVRLAASISLGRTKGYPGLAGALPLLDGPGSPLPSEAISSPLFREHGTTALLYLYFTPSTDGYTQTADARRLVRERLGKRPGELVDVTGEVPASLAQNGLIESRLDWVLIATIVLVCVAVGVHFRALGAAVVAIGAVLAAYVVAERVVAAVGQAGGITLPSEISPVIVVLVFGVATDYAIFFISRFRALLREGADSTDAARQVVRQITPIVFVAGMTVAAGTAALSVAKLEFVSGFGPGLAIAVAVAMLVSATIVPSALAIGGRRLFWPAEIAKEEGAGGEEHDRDRPSRFTPSRLAARHPIVAIALAVAIVAGGASGLLKLALGDQTVKGLPAGNESRRGFEEASRGFAAGVIAPSVVVVSGSGVASHREALSRLEGLLSRRRGVAYVLGPGRQPLSQRLGIALSPSGQAARYLVVLREDPLEARAISDARILQERLPALVRRAGLRSAKATLAGDSALSAEIVDTTLGDLERVTPVMLAAIFLVIALYLRALVAPAYLILTSTLAALASLGLTVYVMQDLLGYSSITYYLIFTVAVLLVSLGSDYNVFMVGRIWQEGRRRSLSEAVELASARAARPISTAGLVLALAFALLAIVPVLPFREIAFAMAVGLLIDAFVIRTILVPALLTLVGPRSAWPGKALSKRE